MNTHPDLRAALVRDDISASLGVNSDGEAAPSAMLFETLKPIDVAPPSKPYHLSNESASGRAEELSYIYT